MGARSRALDLALCDDASRLRKGALSRALTNVTLTILCPLKVEGLKRTITEGRWYDYGKVGQADRPSSRRTANWLLAYPAAALCASARLGGSPWLP